MHGMRDGARGVQVCVEKISGDYCIKMVSVDDSGLGVKEFEPLSGTSSLVHTGSMIPRHTGVSL